MEILLVAIVFLLLVLVLSNPVSAGKLKSVVRFAFQALGIAVLIVASVVVYIVASSSL